MQRRKWGRRRPACRGEGTRTPDGWRQMRPTKQLSPPQPPRGEKAGRRTGWGVGVGYGSTSLLSGQTWIVRNFWEGRRRVGKDYQFKLKNYCNFPGWNQEIPLGWVSIHQGIYIRACIYVLQRPNLQSVPVHLTFRKHGGVKTWRIEKLWSQWGGWRGQNKETK